jgi:hypothetical protein
MVLTIGWGAILLSIAVYYGLDRLMTWRSSKREDRIVRRRLNALKEYGPHPRYWTLNDHSARWPEWRVRDRWG